MLMATLSMEMACWWGMSIAISFRLCTYFTLSRMGMRKLSPGSRVLLNLPILSTSQASCWGTNITPTFTGVLCLLLAALAHRRGEVERRRGAGEEREEVRRARRPRPAPDLRAIAMLSGGQVVGRQVV